MRFVEWIETVPKAVQEDSPWKMKVFWYPLFAADVTWNDVSKLTKGARTRSLADQLYRSVDSVSDNIAEGYSRSSGKDRARFDV